MERGSRGVSGARCAAREGTLNTENAISLSLDIRGEAEPFIKAPNLYAKSFIVDSHSAMRTEPLPDR